MVQTIRIKRRVTGPGAPSVLDPGELAYNDTGHLLFVGDRTNTVQNLVSPNRQVELAGAQTISGTKTIDILNLRITGGTTNYVLSTNGSGTLAWVAQSAGLPAATNAEMDVGTSTTTAATPASVRYLMGAANSTLTTAAKTVVPAINELQSAVVAAAATATPASNAEMDAGIRNDVFGTPLNTRSLMGAAVSTLTTGAKTVVPSINELKTKIDGLSRESQYVGSFSGSTGIIAWTPASGATGLLSANPPSIANDGWQLICTSPGTDPLGGIPAGTYAVGDWLLSDSVSWNHLAFGGATSITASQVAVSPAVQGATNVQSALTVVADNAVQVAGDTMTGNLTTPSVTTNTIITPDTLEVRGTSGTVRSLYITPVWASAASYTRGEIVVNSTGTTFDIGAVRTNAGVAAYTVVIGPVGNAGLSLRANNTVYFSLNQSGHLLAGIDNASDIGTSAGSRPRSLYLGSNLGLDGFVDQAYIVKPASPAASRLRIYAKSDGNVYKLTPDGTETMLGGVTQAYVDAADALKADITYVDSQDALREPKITAGTTAQYWKGDKSWATLDKTAVGLGNVDNTSDASKPVSTAQATADALRVLKAGDTMTGALVLPIAAPTLDTHASNKKYVDDKVAAVASSVVTDTSLTGAGTAGSPLSVNIVDCGTY